jgi:hypothetical protein
MHVRHTHVNKNRQAHVKNRSQWECNPFIWEDKKTQIWHLFKTNGLLNQTIEWSFLSVSSNYMDSYIQGKDVVQAIARTRSSRMQYQLLWKSMSWKMIQNCVISATRFIFQISRKISLKIVMRLHVIQNRNVAGLEIKRPLQNSSYSLFQK